MHNPYSYHTVKIHVNTCIMLKPWGGDPLTHGHNYSCIPLETKFPSRASTECCLNSKSGRTRAVRTWKRVSPAHIVHAIYVRPENHLWSARTWGRPRPGPLEMSERRYQPSNFVCPKCEAIMVACRSAEMLGVFLVKNLPIEQAQA